MRELYEETGASEALLQPVCAYSVQSANAPASYGMLYYADVITLEDLPEFSEITEVILCDTPPENQTYPEIQPLLFQRVMERK